MGSNTISGSDTLNINNHVFSNFADASWIESTFPNDVMTVKVGKNQNAIYGFNAQGSVGELKVRLLRGSADDNFLLGLLSSQQTNPSGFVLMIGQYVKALGDGQGNITHDIYNLAGGVFQKQPEAKSNADGDVDQSVVLWMLKFSSVVRVLS